MADLESAFLRVQDCMKVESVTSGLVPIIAGHDQNSARHHLLHSLSLFTNITNITTLPVLLTGAFQSTHLKFMFLRMLSRKSQ
jgi:hypothetical protein